MIASNGTPNSQLVKERAGYADGQRCPSAPSKDAYLCKNVLTCFFTSMADFSAAFFSKIRDLLYFFSKRELASRNVRYWKIVPSWTVFSPAAISTSPGPSLFVFQQGWNFPTSFLDLAHPHGRPLGPPCSRVENEGAAGGNDF